jgi:diguanylate cyclase
MPLVLLEGGQLRRFAGPAGLARGTWHLNVFYLAVVAAPVADLLTVGIPDARPAVTAGSFGGVQLLSLGFCVRAAMHPRLDRSDRQPWRFLAAAFVLQLLASAALGAALHGDQIPETFTVPMVLGLLLRLAAVPVLLLGLLSFAAVPMDRSARWKVTMDVTTVVGGASMAAWYFLLGPALFGADATTGMVRLTALAYPICDLVLLLGVSTVLLRGVVTSARRPLLLLLAALIGFLASDVALNYLSIFSPDTPFSFWVRMLGLAPIALLGAAAVEQCRQAGAPRRAAPLRPLRPLNSLPYAAQAIGYGLLAVVAVRNGVYPWVGLVAGAVVMSGGVTARQVMSLRERHALVMTDHLTGLANRLRLSETMIVAVERSRRSGVPMALLLIDLDGFKRVNDTFGHETGDAVLVAYADILRQAVRPTDILARLGGDEFAVLLDGVSGEPAAVAVAQRLLAEARNHPALVAGQSITIRASIGIAMADPHDPAGLSDPHKQMRQADQAMYAAKRAKTTGWAIFAADPSPAADEQQRLPPGGSPSSPRPTIPSRHRTLI